MKIFKFVFIVMAFSAFSFSCGDPCKDVTCEYDATCVEGICVCADFTQNYIVGTWNLTFATGTATDVFNTDGTYTTSNGGAGTYTVDQTTTTMTLTYSTGDVIQVSTTNFNCDQFEGTWNGAPITYARQ